MMNERLEIIKDKQLQMHALSTFDINWLIQQAEQLHGTKHKYGYKEMYGICNVDYANLHSRNEELEEKAQELEKIVNKAENHLLRNGNEIMKLTNDIAELKYQNQRYKEVLERIKKSYPVGNDEFVPVEVIYEIQMIIDKALKGETNETSK